MGSIGSSTKGQVRERLAVNIIQLTAKEVTKTTAKEVEGNWSSEGWGGHTLMEPTGRGHDRFIEPSPWSIPEKQPT